MSNIHFRHILLFEYNGENRSGHLSRVRRGRYISKIRPTLVFALQKRKFRAVVRRNLRSTICVRWRALKTLASRKSSQDDKRFGRLQAQNSGKSPSFNKEGSENWFVSATRVERSQQEPAHNDMNNTVIQEFASTTVLARLYYSIDTTKKF